MAAAVAADELEGDGAIELGVVGLVDHAHAPRADRRQEHVAPDHAAARELGYRRWRSTGAPGTRIGRGARDPAHIGIAHAASSRIVSRLHVLEDPAPYCIRTVT